MIRSAVRLPIPGTAWKRFASPAAIARRSSRAEPPESAAIATFGPTPETEISAPEELALVLGREAVERERVVARDQVGVQRNAFATGRGNRSQRLGRDGEPVADAAGVDDDVVGAPDERPRR